MSIRDILRKRLAILKELIRYIKTLIALLRAKKNLDISRLYEIMSSVAFQEGVSIDLALSVATCESGLDPLAMNRNRNGSIDRGLFQWNDYWHPEISNACAFDIECSTRAFCKAVKAGNIYWWNSSKHCWG